MSLRDQYAEHLSNFDAAAKEGINNVLAEGNYGYLRRLDLNEVDEGVFAEIEIALTGEVVDRWGSDVYSRRFLIVRPEDGPMDPADFAAALVHTSVMEDLDTAGRGPAT
ncbi:hypothetical protein [Streptomyces zingiberis]|uniref:Uncharacterized protein n=1 Tax=Streptomyces zingiberis TaxID=2053010 RepID=A0ABX1C5A6_9ACTN|nr:hypothetical protein [Streptomyces zingiberis]NJQ03986.1 hypothetical protein [Streptomyces zingiberis]